VYENKKELQLNSITVRAITHLIIKVAVIRKTIGNAYPKSKKPSFKNKLYKCLFNINNHDKNETTEVNIKNMSSNDITNKTYASYEI